MEIYWVSNRNNIAILFEILIQIQIIQKFVNKFILSSSFFYHQMMDLLRMDKIHEENFHCGCNLGLRVSYNV